MFRRSNLLRYARIAPLFAALLAAFSSASAAPDKVTFAWPGVLSSGYAPFTFAKELGISAKENIDVDLVLLQGAGTIVPQILNGSVFTAFLTPPPLVVARQPGGPNFDMRYIYNVVRRSVWEMVVLDSSPIKSIKDLNGKTIGIGGFTFGNVPWTKAILAQEGVDPNKVQFIPVGLGIPAFDALKRGKIDMLNLYDIMNVMLEQDTKIRRLPQPAEFENVSSYGFPVSNKTIREKPDLIARFGRVFAEGTVACKANLEGCLASYWKAHPEQKPQVLDKEAMRREMAILEVRLNNMLDPGGAIPAQLGAFTDADWSMTIKSLVVGDQLKDANIPLDSLYTNQFVAEYNKFDRNEVIAKAKAYPGPVVK